MAANKFVLPEHLEALDAAVKQLITPPIWIWEPFTFFYAVQEIIVDVMPAATKEEYEEALRDVWTYYDGRYRIIEEVDKLVRVGFMFEPFDGPVFRYTIERIAIPQMAKYLADRVG